MAIQRRQGKQPSVMRHKFSEVPRAQIPRSRFDRSFALKTTFDAGVLVPVYVDEALPGDTFTMRMSAFARMATPIKPIMDNLYLDSFFFAVPNRLVWDNWQKFMGEQDNPGDSTDYTVPVLTGFNPSENTLHDYMGLPVGQGFITDCSALFQRAYYLIYNEWFRDQNLVDSIVVPKDDGPDAPANWGPARRGKRHDYFTSCLPWPQKGEAVTVPLGDQAPIQSNSNVATGQLGIYSTLESEWRELTTGPGANPEQIRISDTPLSDVENDGMYADLSNATASTINQLRQAFQIQKLLERDARGGTRYTEIIKSHFGVTSPDHRLQRPEYLGGGSQAIVVNPVVQTSKTDVEGPDASPQGNLAAIGTAAVRGHGFTKSFTEHCIIIGLVNVRADLTYQQGMERMFSRSTRYDYYWPALSHIGEQAVLRKEIYFVGSEGDDNQAFGYQERYAEYRYKPSKITGLFRSGASESLDIWHLSQNFEAPPQLSQQFIEEDPPIDRVIAVPDEPHFLFDSYFKLTCARPMPVYGVPGLIDHF